MTGQAASKIQLYAGCGLRLNPCPRGFYTHPRKQRTCGPTGVLRYQKRISGPLLDRIDLFAEVPPVEYEKLVAEELSEDSVKVRQRVERARVFHRILKVSRTIADPSAALRGALDGSAEIKTAHLAEALQYRQRGVG